MVKYDYTCYFDGACEPVNPGGNMGIGAIIFDSNMKEVKSLSHFVKAKPENSNNVAEYQGFGWLIKELSFLMKDGQNVLIKGDSRLVVSQMNNEWRIKDGFYVQFAERAKVMLKILKDRCAIKIEWIPREQNDICDKLSKQKMIENKVEFRLQP